MTGTSQSSSRPAKHVHHGRTLAAWVGSMLATVAFVVGAIGLIIGSWTTFWIAVALVVIALIATVVLQKTGHGAY
jgi:hypothetical protein